MFEARSASFESWRFAFLSYIRLLAFSKRLNDLHIQIAITDIFTHVARAVTLLKSSVCKFYESDANSLKTKGSVSTVVAGFFTRTPQANL